MKEITLLDLLRSGVHFGHQTSRWHPKMEPFIFTQRNGISIIDLEQTKARLLAAAEFAKQVTSRGGKVLFVGTKRQAKPILLKYAEQTGMPFVVDRWLGGTFTNFATIQRLIDDFRRLKEERGSGMLTKYTKKEQSMFQREIERLEKLVGGISLLTKLPEAIFVIDLKQEKTAVREAQKRGIPIIAMVDTNVNPNGVTYPIPANDDATKSIDFVTDVLSQAILEGQAEYQRGVEESATIAAAAAAAAVPAEEVAA
jgi:small subunit ribosomal protein S2